MIFLHFNFQGNLLRLARVDRLLAGAELVLRRSRDRLPHRHPQPRHQLPRGEMGQRGNQQTVFSKFVYKTNLANGGGRHSTEVALALPTQPSSVQFLAIPNFFNQKN